MPPRLLKFFGLAPLLVSTARVDSSLMRDLGKTLAHHIAARNQPTQFLDFTPPLQTLDHPDINTCTAITFDELLESARPPQPNSARNIISHLVSRVLVQQSCTFGGVDWSIDHIFGPKSFPEPDEKELLAALPAPPEDWSDDWLDDDDWDEYIGNWQEAQQNLVDFQAHSATPNDDEIAAMVLEALVKEVIQELNKLAYLASKVQ